MTGPMGPASFDGFDEPDDVRAARLNEGTIDEFADLEVIGCGTNCDWDSAAMEQGPRCWVCGAAGVA